MPIEYKNHPLFRIRFKDANIREVRHGDELEWGLYKITYVNKGPKDVIIGWQTGMNIPNYVWGYPHQEKDDFEIVIPDDATAAEAKSKLGAAYGYRSHSDGWFEENDCLSFFPAVERDFHKDLKLFCKWRQRKYCFNGTYLYEKEITEEVWVPGHWEIKQ